MCNHILYDHFNCNEWHISHAKVFLLSHQKGETQERLLYMWTVFKEAEYSHLVKRPIEIELYAEI